ncbi:MAG TPA: Smr/MutS family protein [Pseudolabrys sp.]|jgi:DNA-nicking Smr family endonuclease|nr:Smr/MutS family protein [Pseudolabrys sp.]
MSGRDGRRRGLRPEERELWSVFTSKIEPLKKPRRAAAADDEEEPVPPLAAVKPRAGKAAAAKPAPAPAKPASPPPLETLGRRVKQRVARGKEAIDGRLDLHGMTQSEAHAALLAFLRKASAREAKVVLVITGKGARAADGERERGVLRRQVPQWLGLPEFRAFVIGFEEAGIRHGGEGALYVRVRRGRG